MINTHTVPFVGKFVGSAIFEPVLERIGFKMTIYIVCIIQVVAIIIERASTGKLSCGLTDLLSDCQ